MKLISIYLHETSFAIRERMIKFLHLLESVIKEQIAFLLAEHQKKPQKQKQKKNWRRKRRWRRGGEKGGERNTLLEKNFITLNYQDIYLGVTEVRERIVVDRDFIYEYFLLIPSITPRSTDNWSWLDSVLF